MKKLCILHLGIGNVGKEAVRQIAAQKGKIERELQVSLEYMGRFNSRNSEEEICKAIQAVALPFVLIDTTASDKTIPYIAKALRRGGFAVLANKKPLSGRQNAFDMLHELAGPRLLYECTVGAGLPVIRSLKDLIMTGDEIVEIQGCFSGTLGFLFSKLDDGKLFSEAILEAKEKGFTEPDPRDDLSGKDVLRKALILARIIGRKIEAEDIGLVSLYPEKMQRQSSEDFLKNMNKLDEFYAERVKKAKRKKRVLRFVAKVNPYACSVGLAEVDEASEMGMLKGTDNLIVIRTKRYSQNPLVIKGPGAGVEVTAAGVFANLLSVAKVVKGGGINKSQFFHKIFSD